MMIDWTAVRAACRRLRCDRRTFLKELEQPGSVRGRVGLAIRVEIARMREAEVPPCAHCGHAHDVAEASARR